MKILKLFAKEKVHQVSRPILPTEHAIARNVAISKHEKIIVNLGNELESLSSNLKALEQDFGMLHSKREKESDRMIRRIILVKYEIEIREGLIKWLC